MAVTDPCNSCKRVDLRPCLLEKVFRMRQWEVR